MAISSPLELMSMKGCSLSAWSDGQKYFVPAYLLFTYQMISFCQWLTKTVTKSPLVMLLKGVSTECLQYYNVSPWYILPFLAQMQYILSLWQKPHVLFLLSLNTPIATMPNPVSSILIWKCQISSSPITYSLQAMIYYQVVFLIRCLLFLVCLQCLLKLLLESNSKGNRLLYFMRNRKLFCGFQSSLKQISASSSSNLDMYFYKELIYSCIAAMVFSKCIVSFLHSKSRDCNSCMLSLMSLMSFCPEVDVYMQANAKTSKKVRVTLRLLCLSFCRLRYSLNVWACTLAIYWVRSMRSSLRSEQTPRLASLLGGSMGYSSEVISLSSLLFLPCI